MARYASGMPTTQEIKDKAIELGAMIAEHDDVKKLKDVMAKLETDTDARQAMQQYQETLMGLARKEQSGQPIEVADKRALEAAQTAVVHNLTIQQYQQAQMAYVDLVRALDAEVYKDDPLGMREQQQQAMAGGGGAGGPGGGGLVM